ncbi:hypothetical protein NFI96_004639 [Prochilodus magdalenae]|nr:hypothetical protein NFI96_004639 [Prochilodus magdalenae]
MEVIVGGLQPETTYSVTVAAYTIKGDGARSPAQTVQTPGTVPDPPSLSVQLIAETSVMVSWMPQNKSGLPSDVTGFRLTYGLKNATPSLSIDLKPQERQYNVTDLLPGATYTFLVSVRGRSVYSPETLEELMIPEYPPAGFPVLSETANASCCSLHFSWVPPDLGRGSSVITGYTLAYGETETSQEPRQIMLMSRDTSYTIHGLNPDREYDVSIRAHNRVGPGPFSPRVRYRTAAFDTGIRSATWGRGDQGTARIHTITCNAVQKLRYSGIRERVKYTDRNQCVNHVVGLK